MSDPIEQQLIDNISQLLKRSIVADSALKQLRTDNKAKFSRIFTEESPFERHADTFQPYIEEIADDLLIWQQSKSQPLLIKLVKKIEQLFKVLTEFESHYNKG
ncbi:hypothetical protein [Thalassotalea mangrovi]|uniref:Prephenate dehydrogenase n=1 Tax=Thalassotalea mangrovi TaxID=2572245 RepID=A0A4U1B3E0_9GAMM|nr:hypothetical protein [Thalassotalea mangrovi]TKB43983.1 hypothetical protein E8M12_13495 [Thalassotalea mangrovi]